MKVKLSATIAALLLASIAVFAQDKTLTGFTTENTNKEFELEKEFDSYLKAENLREWMKILTDEPHHVGSPYGKKNADFMAAKFKEWGYDTEIEEYQVLFPTPAERVLELTYPTKYKAGLREPALKEDATSSLQKLQLPVYNCFSADGDVTGELVFVNYGIPSDYEELKKLGIDVKGKIVIAKYGGSWRGIKPKVAAENGAIGCIIYSDPKDDGYFRGDVYPKGPFKNEYGAQRGSVLDMPLYPGDPLTPGYGATKDAKRIAMEEAPTLLTIPVLPISYKDAEPLLAAMGGPVIPDSWKGALPITYHAGPGPATVHLKLKFNWDLKPAYNVIAKMKGSEFPDEWIIRGNHHDAWVNGASDPVSGMVAVMEEARAISELTKKGWKPKRTLIFCAWDAEEPGLLGSTEWVEDHQDELKDKAVVYINSDGNGRGFLYAGGSHTLEKFFGEIARDVIDPQKGISVAKRREAYMQVNGIPYSEFKLSALGSGSDYSPFIQHLGIASLNIGYGGENAGGEYHSIYDSFDHYVRFKDPDFQYGVALCQTGGRTTLRFANADYLPFEFSKLASTVSTYADEVMKLADQLRESTIKENKMITDGIYEAYSDPKKTFIIPEVKDEVPYFNFAPLQNSLEKLQVTASTVSTLLDQNKAESKELDKMLYQSERHFTKEAGLPIRPWYKHHLYAPGFYTGYGVKTLPGVREAIEQRDWDLTEEQIKILADVLDDFTKHLNKIKTSLQSE
ncbi:M28 family metallopeptidase [Chondrinema litorale]|uniref:M28 family metallopeptidase n=1 Tax=Chondrinema litorale TaxID=2994555 RepID=UPI002543F7C7|nr:M28 family metallopeptidase [Chondrinema litorale]UZR94283.1 M28 family metallopeptidase [Chondrinema litorale]